MGLGTAVFIIWLFLTIAPEGYAKLAARMVKAYNIEMEQK